MNRFDYDVVILGGAFSGASTALLLCRENPELRVLVVEKQESFDQKVGEATTEMSGMFLTRRLALWEHLERNHLPKEGLRHWFSNEKVTGHANASEAGGFHRSTVPSFQLRRDVLDEHVLAVAAREGAEVWRPARVKDVTTGEYDHEVVVEKDGEGRTIRCRWLVDATGRVSFLGRKLELMDRNDEHQVASMWARWTGVRHIDDLAARIPDLAARNCGSRRLGTNHYMGHGYWIWVIPLQTGETSIGIVWDKRIVALHESREREADYEAFLRAIPPLGELLESAARKPDDFRFYSHLPYVARQYMGKGWALVGDAAAFLDPYYSPGLDHCAFSVESTVAIIGSHFRGEDVDERVEMHNAAFQRSYWRFFRSIYDGKYQYMGEHDLLSAATILDTAHYYIFLVIPAYRLFKRFYWMPVLGPREAFVSYHLMSLYNRRFRRIAKLRREMGEAGRRNDGRRINMFFTLGAAPFHMVLRGLKIWALAELDAVRLGARKLAGLGPRVPVPGGEGEPRSAAGGR
jgi:flavin-dependent dehydrogenase